MGQRPTTRSRHSNPPLQPLTYCWIQLWVDCCIASSNSGHLRPRPHLSHYFLMGLTLAPPKKEPAMALPHPVARAYHGPIGSHGALSWGHCCSTHGEKRESCWRVGWWGLIFAVVCVCCVYSIPLYSLPTRSYTGLYNTQTLPRLSANLQNQYCHLSLSVTTSQVCHYWSCTLLFECNTSNANLPVWQP